MQARLRAALTKALSSRDAVAAAEADIAGIVSAEIADRRSAANDYDRLGRTEQSALLRREADVLATMLDGG
jgi:uncharacterized protein YqeY